MLIKLFDIIAAGFVIALAAIFRFIPTAWLFGLGRFFGIFISMFNKDRRVIGYGNLKAAYSNEKTPKEIKKILAGVYRTIAGTFMEILSLTKVNEGYIDKYVKIKNTHNFWKVYHYKDGAILLTAHFGNWELSGMASAIKGFPLYVLAREQKMKKLNELINLLRESKGLRVVRKGVTIRYIVKALREGKMIGMVADQDAGKSGCLSNFFGRPASTAIGPYKFSLKTSAIIQPAFMCRIKGPYHELVLEDPILIKKGEDIVPFIDNYNRLLERYIRKYPDQWLWLHKRWKSTSVKKVLVLSDGKKGHLNQSLAVVKQIENYRRQRPNYKEGTTHIEIAQVSFKSPFFKALFNLASLFFSWRCQGCMRCLKACLKEDSYNNLMQKYADVVVNCGSSLAGVNRLITIECNAKNIVIMKPSFLSLNNFNIAIVPRHDVRRRSPKHVVITDISPNLIDKEYLDYSSMKIRESVNFSKPFKIGILLGGDNADFILTEEAVSRVLDAVFEVSMKNDAEILMTTSRRTPGRIERLVKNRFSGEPRCKLLVIPNEKEIPDAVGGILGLSNIIVVSGESVSMVSEAVSSGKRTIVFKPKKRRNSVSKYEKMLARLAADRYIDIAEPGNLSEAIRKALASSDKPKEPTDRFRIYEQMWRVGV